MAYDNKEVEINIALSEKEFSIVRDKVCKLAKFMKKIDNTDEYFTPKHRSFIKQEHPSEWLSLRKRGEKTVLNYKHWYPENVEIADYCDEFETEISNLEQFKRILQALNFDHLVTVDKERETFVYNDEFEINLDSVKELGHFIEIESIKDFGDVSTTKQKLIEFTQLLGVNMSNATNGYPSQLIKKKEEAS